MNSLHAMRRRGAVILGVAAVAAITTAGQSVAAGATRAALPAGAIKHIMVIDFENLGFNTTFGPTSPMAFLNSALVPNGELIENYYATSHVSMGNYISQISGQASTPAQNNDCLDLATLKMPSALKGGFTDITPGTPAANGQVNGDGCVFPASVQTIGNQLDAKAKSLGLTYPWRMYAEDMGNDPTRDYGTPDSMGGTDCAHPAINGADNSNSATAIDQYATRHNPWMYFHSIIDNTKLCNQRVVPLGIVKAAQFGYSDIYGGHLAQDLRSVKTTPAFSFVSPNLCNDAHDAVCAGPDSTGAMKTTNLVAADRWLQHWIPLIMQSPAYQSGHMLVVITFDEATLSDATACCGQQAGPGQQGNPGYSPILGMLKYQTTPTAAGVYPGGGRVGAVLLNPRYIKPGTRNTTGAYNHYSALRSYEDLLGITTGGTDGMGHLGFAAQAGLKPFGRDVFNNPTGA